MVEPMLRKRLFGVIPPIVTPILPNEDVDEEGVRALVEHCIASGLHGIFVAGSNGEAMSITQAERNRLIHIVIDQARDQGACTVRRDGCQHQTGS